MNVIDAKKLSPYYHTDVFPERIPLHLIKNTWVDEGSHLSKFGRSVDILSSTETGTPYMNISSIQISGDSATVSFEYPPEGLVGTAKLSRQREVWALDSMTLHER